MKHIITSILLLNCYALHAQTQLGSDIDGEAADDLSGMSVSMNSTGDRVAIGAFYNDNEYYCNIHGGVFLTDNNTNDMFCMGLSNENDQSNLRNSENPSINLSREYQFTSHIIDNSGIVEHSRSIKVADLDNDNDLDVVVAGKQGNHGVYWYENDGFQNYTSHLIGYQQNSPGYSFSIADIDSDGDIDIILPKWQGTEIEIYVNNGSGNFTTSYNIDAACPFTYSVSTGDLNGDGNLDMVESYDCIALHVNDGNENFSYEILDTFSASMRFPQLADIDNDSDLDIITVQTDAIVIMYNVNGTFSEEDYDYIDTDATQIGVNVGDINNDGFMDIISSAANGVLFWHENDGSMDFVSHEIYNHPQGYGSSYIKIADMNGDTYLDIVTTYWSGDIFIHENNGLGIFSNNLVLNTGNGTAEPYCIDIDEDGDIDIVSTQANTDIIYWHENLSDNNVEYTYVPDDNFEQALIDLGYDDVLDNYVVTDSISSVTYLNVSSKEISDLTGIQGFTALTNLHCGYNQLPSLNVSSNTALTQLNCLDNVLTTLDVSSNTALTNLNCRDNQLTSLDVSSNTALTDLYCYNNQLTTLDISNTTALELLQCYNNQLTTLDLSSSTAITYLRFSSNQLTSLDVSSNTALINLHCDYNQLTSLDVSTNTALTYLDCRGNVLTTLDISNNPALEEVYCYATQLTSLDVSSNTALTSLNCSYNQLTSLDVSANTSLTSLVCWSNQLTYLNMKNGITDSLTTFNATNNSSLTCIEVLDTDIDWATTNWTSVNGNIDEGVTFSEICSGNPNYTNVPDDNFEQALIDLGYDDTLDDYVLTENISGVTSLNVSDESIADLTGIQSFTALTTLHCYNNQLDSLDVSNNTLLTYLSCYNNQLVSLDVSNNTALTTLYCYYNQLTSLDVSNNTALTTLYCYGSSSTSSYGVTNQITALDVSNNTALTYLSCYYNQLTTLDVSNNTALTYLYCGYQPLTELDVSNNTALTSLYCHSSELTVLDVTNNTSLNNLGAAYNNLTAFDVSLNTALTYLSCTGNDLTALDVSANTALTSLYVSSNDLTALDVSNNLALVNLSCGSNDLTTLDVSVNTALEYIYCGYNELDSLDVSNNTALNNLSCASNNFTVLDVSVNIGLTRFLCGNNELTDLDVSNNTALENFRCDNNSLTSLDISNNRDLEEIHFQGNQLTSLDVSVHTALEKLYCHSNQLNYLNMKNGVTDQLTTFNATSNPNLTCIETLDPDYATTNWTYEDGNIDEGVTFAIVCGNANWHVATTGSDSTGDGSYENPFATIQQGIDAANNGDTVSVAAGTYVENISYSGKNISVFGEDRETTIINGDSFGTVVTFENGEDSTAVLSGFTITNGNGSGIAGYEGRGGGVFCINSSPTLNDLTVDGNQAENSGAGLWFGYSNSQLVDLIISNNSVVGQGSNAGGGISMNYYSDLTLNNMLLVGNEAVYGAGIELWRYSKPLLNNVTIVGNTGSFGGGLLLSGGCNATLINSILWGNSPHQIMIGVSQTPDSVSISYSNVFAGLDSIHTNDNGIITWGDGNIDADPLFCEPDSSNFNLSENSPCFGSGQDGADMGAFGVGCGTLDIEFPSIGNIWDVPDDQGNWVYIQFTPSFHDASDEGPLGSYTIERLDDEEWVSLHSIDAYGAEHYTTEAHTLMDSTGEDDGMTSYRIVAAMEVGALISEPAAGYSIDNIAPGVPTGLMATVSETGIHLSWDLSTAEDFQYFDLEISSTADFSDYLTVETADTVYLDADYEVNVTVYYRLVAYDDGGNASEHSVAIDITVLWADLGIAIPDEFAIHQNYPNPFNPVTTLRYDLPEQGHVRITIYDMLGRDVKTLINEYQDPGYRSIIWDATNDYGKPVSAGMYLYQIQAGEYNSTKKMVLLK